MRNPIWATNKFLVNSEADLGRSTDFVAAVIEASRAREAGKQVIMLAIADHKTARHHLPIFLASLKAAGSLDQHLVVATLDHAAHIICQKVGFWPHPAIAAVVCRSQQIYCRHIAILVPTALENILLPTTCVNLCQFTVWSKLLQDVARKKLIDEGYVLPPGWSRRQQNCCSYLNTKNHTGLLPDSRNLKSHLLNVWQTRIGVLNSIIALLVMN